MSTSDEELDRLKRRKLVEMQRQLLKEKLERKAAEEAKSTPKHDPERALRASLVEQGEEVLNAFKAQYPQAARILIPLLGKAVLEGRIRGSIDGGSLLQFLRSLGYRVHIETKIYVGKRGELKELSEYLRERSP